MQKTWIEESRVRSIQEVEFYHYAKAIFFLLECDEFSPFEKVTAEKICSEIQKMPRGG